MNVGDQLGPYRIERLLGRGGMGSVFLAHDTRLGRRVAIKVLLPEHTRDSTFRDRFLRESRIAASIEHPHIVPIYDAGEIDEQLYLVMRFIDGTTLRELLRSSGRLPLERTTELLEQIGSALTAAHKFGLVHRDVKPANIMITAGATSHGDHAYLTDFGIARRIETVSLTATGAFVGTLDYAAPEQFRGEPVDPRTDVYALGCMLYECLVGGPPFRRPSDAAVMYAHLEQPPPRVTDHRPDLPSSVDDVIAAALAKDKTDRYAACSDFTSAWRAAASHPQGDRPATTPTAPIAVSQAGDADLTSPTRTLVEETTDTDRPRRRRLIGLAGTLAILAVLGAALLLTRSNLMQRANEDATEPSPTPTANRTSPAPVTAPWKKAKLTEEDVGPAVVDIYRSAPNLETCAAVHPSDLGTPSAEPRSASFLGGWGVTWDLPAGPGRDPSGTYCEQCGRGAFGIGANLTVEDFGEVLRDRVWSDGSAAEIDADDETPTGQDPSKWARLVIADHGCVYQLWSYISRDHLIHLMDNLRFVDLGD